MERFFNTAGPIKPRLHYNIPSLQRVDWDEIQMLIASEKYFILHAPRQTGKTSALLAMLEVLNKSGQYNTVYANIEGAQVARNNVESGIKTVCNVIADSAKIYVQEPRLLEWFFEQQHRVSPENLLRSMLTYLVEISDKPVVLFIDEADALVGDTLISLLRQIRAGYGQRPDFFPQSIVLCGLRDIKDYRIHRSDGEIITGGSAFNIKAKSLRIGNFNEQEIKDLYQQHTQETGQEFTSEVFKEAWLDTSGQPWLVNALAHEITWEDRTARDRTTPITMERYFAARERLIQSRSTHLDQLADKLSEERVHKVISTLLAGEETSLEKISPDDLQYVEDLGLIVSRPQLRIGNQIYREIIPRELTWVAQSYIIQESSWYLDAENKLDMSKLLTAFQQFFRENAESWIERFDYKEAGPQLLIQAFLQRIINGGGRLNREYSLGSKRTDLLIEWPVNQEQGFYGEVQRIVIELKIKHGSLNSLIKKGMEQTAEYADKVNADEAHLIIFDRDQNIKWQDKIWQRTAMYQDMQLELWGC